MIDIGTIFCTAQNVFSAQTDVDSTDWIKLGAAKDLAAGNPVDVEIIVTTAFVGAGASVTFKLLAVDSAGANPVVLDQTAPIAVTGGALAAGKRFILRMSPKVALPAATLTHLRLRATTTAVNTTAGAITAHLNPAVASAQPAKDYAAGF